LIEKRPDLIAAFLRAYIEGLQQFKTNKPVAYNIIAKNSGIEDRSDIEEYHKLLTTRFLLDYPLPTLAGPRVKKSEDSRAQARGPSGHAFRAQSQGKRGDQIKPRRTYEA